MWTPLFWSSHQLWPDSWNQFNNKSICGIGTLTNLIIFISLFQFLNFNYDAIIINVFRWKGEVEEGEVWVPNQQGHLLLLFLMSTKSPPPRMAGRGSPQGQAICLSSEPSACLNFRQNPPLAFPLSRLSMDHRNRQGTKWSYEWKNFKNTSLLAHNKLHLRPTHSIYQSCLLFSVTCNQLSQLSMIRKTLGFIISHYCLAIDKSFFFIKDNLVGWLKYIKNNN